MKQIYLAARQALGHGPYLAMFLVAAGLFLAVFVTLPVATIPGNSFAFQLAIFRVRDYLLMAALAVLAGLNLTIRVYRAGRLRAGKKLPALCQGTTTGALGVMGAMVGTASCASCLAALLGLVGLGTGSVFFMLQYRWYFLLGAVALMLWSLALTARKVTTVCRQC